MAKRFTDSNKWDDDWFLELSIEYKLAWNYICDRCDAVGVWKPSRKAIAFHLGVDVDLVEFLKICGKDRIFVMPGGNWWIRKFCFFNYGDLEVSTSKTSLHYIKLLKNHGLWIEYTRGINTPKEQEKEKAKDQVKEKGGVGDFETNWRTAFDERTTESYIMQFKHLDVANELMLFRLKCNGNPKEYHNRDPGGLRTAFLYQLKNSKANTQKNERPNTNSAAIIPPDRGYSSSIG